MCPAMLASDWLSPGPACGKLSSTHSTTVTVKMIVPARRRKIHARCHRPIARSRSGGHWYLGSSMMKPEAEPLVTVRRSTSAAAIAPTMPGDVEREQHQPLQADAPADRGRRDERGDDHRIDRQPRRAGHQRGDQDRGQPVLGIGDRARRHDPGNGAGEARQQRDEAAAREADVGHQPVHDERRAGHVARLLHHQDEGEQDHDLRQEHDHRADAGEHALGQQVAQQARRAGRRWRGRSARRRRRRARRRTASPRRTPPGRSRTAARTGSAGRATGAAAPGRAARGAGAPRSR